LENNLQNKDSLLEKIKNENEQLHKKIKIIESEQATQEQTFHKFKYDCAEKEKNLNYEKSSLIEENKNLKNM